MSASFRQITHWAVAFGFAGLSATVPSGTAQAQFFDPFAHFFAHPAPTYAPPAASHRDVRPSTKRAHRSEHVRHATVPKPAAKRIRFASLPGAEPLSRRTRVSPLEREPEVKEKARSEGKPKPTAREPTGDPVAALMTDKTLRRGDIVVLPGGVKVFKGDASAPHRPTAFEDVSRSKLVAAAARRQLMAMPIQPSAARPNTADVAVRDPGKDGSSPGETVATTGSLPKRAQP